MTIVHKIYHLRFKGSLRKQHNTKVRVSIDICFHDRGERQIKKSENAYLSQKYIMIYTFVICHINGIGVFLSKNLMCLNMGKKCLI